MLNKDQQRLADAIYKNLVDGKVAVEIMEKKIVWYNDQAAIHRECAAELRRQGNSAGHVAQAKAFVYSSLGLIRNAEATQDAINRYKSTIVTN